MSCLNGHGPGSSPHDESGVSFLHLSRWPAEDDGPSAPLHQLLLHAADVAWRHGNTGERHLPETRHQMVEGYDDTQVGRILIYASNMWKVWQTFLMKEEDLV